MITRSRKAALLALLILSPLPAFAYVDPGSGMLLIQGLIAIVGAIVVFVKHPIDTLVKIWRHLRRK